jgi:site-specific DNA recombinase
MLREEWVGIEVPAIISRELFDRVQQRMARNKNQYRNPRQVQLLSGLVRCGSCGGSVYAMRWWERSNRKAPVCIIHKVA